MNKLKFIHHEGKNTIACAEIKERRKDKKRKESIDR